MNSINYMKATNDANGNPRFVVHFSEFLTESEISEGMLNHYDTAKKRAKKITGCIPYKGNDFGGGYVFQAVDERHAESKVQKVMIGIGSTTINGKEVKYCTGMNENVKQYNEVVSGNVANIGVPAMDNSYNMPKVLFAANSVSAEA